MTANWVRRPFLVAVAAPRPHQTRHQGRSAPVCFGPALGSRFPFVVTTSGFFHEKNRLRSFFDEKKPAPGVFFHEKNPGGRIGSFVTTIGPSPPKTRP
jgi:hypothetical protein